jgi:hypothetical protein
MSIPSKEEVIDELELIAKNYPQEGEKFDVMADYVLSVAEEAYSPGPKPYLKTGMIRAEENKLLLDIYAICLPNSAGDHSTPDMLSIALFDYLTKTYSITRK